MSDAAASALTTLLAIMARLRDPQRGCPWDREQDFTTVAPYTIEEAYEVEAAIASGEPARLLEELGDLLFQVVYHAQLAEERGWFGFAAVAEAIAAKMIRRHPHVFGEAPQRATRQQIASWEEDKAAERAARAEHGVLAGIPLALPALTRALKLSRRAARIGFDWPDAAAVLVKLEEEFAELKRELASPAPAADHAKLCEEFGDLLFVLVNLARKLGLDAEQCLREANRKFERRFHFIEQALAKEGKTPAEVALERMEALWQEAKEAEKQMTISKPKD